MPEADRHQLEGLFPDDVLEVIREAELSQSTLDEDLPERRCADQNLVCCVGNFCSGAGRQLRRIVPPPEKYLRIEQKTHSGALPMLKFLFTHGIEIWRDPYPSLRPTGNARLAFCANRNETNKRLAIAGYHDILACKCSFDEARKRAFRLVHVYEFGHRDGPS